MSEFSLIDIVRARCAHARHDVARGIGDDAAVLDVPSGQRLVACTDTLVEGVHFLRGTAPADIGWKSLAVNLSDLAAMGAEPAWALLALTLPNDDARFIEDFARGFDGLARIHDVALVGGDTTQGPLSVTVTVLGLIPRDAAMTRAGARAGDDLFVTGTLGDAAGALTLLRETRRSHAPQSPFLRKGEDKLHPLPLEGGRRAAAGGCDWADPRPQATQPQLVARLHRPEPRIAAGLALRGVATACIDVSDGLLADLGHVCKASGVGAEIERQRLSISSALAKVFDEDACRAFALTGGDDYELCFSAPQDRAEQIDTVFAKLDLRVTRIGRIVAGAGVRVLDAHGNAIATHRAGWEHFGGLLAPCQAVAPSVPCPQGKKE